MAVDDDFPGEGILEFYLDIPELSNTAIFGKIVNNHDLPDGEQQPAYWYRPEGSDK